MKDNIRNFFSTPDFYLDEWKDISLTFEEDVPQSAYPSQEFFSSWEAPAQGKPPIASMDGGDFEIEIPSTSPPPMCSTYPNDTAENGNMSKQTIQAITQLAGQKKKSDISKQSQKFLQRPNRAKAIGAFSQELVEELPLRVCQGAFYVYITPIWRIVSDDELIQIIREKYQDEDLIFSLGNQGLAFLTRLLRTSPALQIEPDEFNNHRNLINLTDGVFNLQTGEICLPSAHYMFTSHIDISRFEIENTQPNGTFERIVQSAFDNDANKRQLLLEIIGTILSPSLPKKFYAFVGASNTGKSKLGEFIKSLVGDLCSLNLENGPSSLRDKFTLGEFPGKLLVFCFELQDVPLDVKTVAKIKQITGDGSLLSGEKKYGAKLQFVNMAKLLFCSNHAIRITQSTEDQAFWNRLILLPFEHSIPESQQDPYLLEKLNEERGWIVKQALQAYRELEQKNFMFTQVDIPPQYRPNAQGKSWQAHIHDFVVQACTIVPENRVRIEDLYVAYRQYCRITCTPPCDKQHFSAALGSCFPISVRRCKMDGGSSRGFEGIALSEDYLALP